MSSNFRNKTDLPLIITWPKFNVGCSDYKLRQRLNELKLHDKVIGYIDDFVKERPEIPADMSLQIGPSPIEILQSITLKGSLDQFNLEKLEFLGDAYLYFSMSIKIILESTSVEKRWGFRRNELASNLHLYKIGELKQLSTYLIREPYIEKHFIPPGYIMAKKNEETEYKVVAAKTIADCVEALIGLYLKHGGEKSALYFMQWIGLSPIPNYENENTKDII